MNDNLRLTQIIYIDFQHLELFRKDWHNVCKSKYTVYEIIRWKKETQRW